MMAMMTLAPEQFDHLLHGGAASADFVVILAWAAGGGAVALTLAATIRWWLGRRTSDEAVERRLLRAMGVSREDGRLLRSAASACGLTSALSMLISRGCFDHALAVAPVSAPDRRRLASLRRSMFDD